jgi:hypothetical protein
MKLGGEDSYKPDELPTALSRDVDGKDTTLFVSFPREKVDIFAHLYF